MTYLSEEAKVVYKSKDGNEEKIFDALEWVAPCVLMSKIRVSRLSVITDTIVMSAAVSGKSMIRRAS